MLFASTEYTDLVRSALPQLSPDLVPLGVAEAPAGPWRDTPGPVSAAQAWSSLRDWAAALAAVVRSRGAVGPDVGWVLDVPAAWACAAEDALRWAGLHPWYLEQAEDGVHLEQAFHVRPALRSAVLRPDVAAAVGADQVESWAREQAIPWLFAGAKAPKNAVLEVTERIKQWLPPGAGIVLRCRPCLLGALETALERAGYCVWHDVGGALQRGFGTWTGAWQRGLGLAKNALPWQGKGVSDLRLAQVLGDAELLALATSSEPRELVVKRCLQRWFTASAVSVVSPQEGEKPSAVDKETFSGGSAVPPEAVTGSGALDEEASPAGLSKAEEARSGMATSLPAAPARPARAPRRTRAAAASAPLPAQDKEELKGPGSAAHAQAPAQSWSRSDFPVIHAWFGDRWHDVCKTAGLGDESDEKRLRTLEQCLVQAGQPPCPSESVLPASLERLRQAWAEICDRTGTPFEPLDVLYLAALLGINRDARLYRGQLLVACLADVRLELAKAGAR